MNDTQANEPVTASLVASNRRLTFLPTYFGPRLMMRGESLVYAWLRRLSEDYDGGFWNYYELLRDFARDHAEAAEIFRAID